MARPKKAPTDRRDAVLSVRLTAVERAELDRVAGAHGLSVAEFLRRRALDYRLPPLDAEQQHQAEAATALIRLGVNLNQIAKHLNAGRSPVMDSLSALLSRIHSELDALYDPGPGRRPQL